MLFWKEVEKERRGVGVNMKIQGEDGVHVRSKEDEIEREAIASSMGVEAFLCVQKGICRKNV